MNDLYERMKEFYKLASIGLAMLLALNDDNKKHIAGLVFDDDGLLCSVINTGIGGRFLDVIPTIDEGENAVETFLEELIEKRRIVGKILSEYENGMACSVVPSIRAYKESTDQ